MLPQGPIPSPSVERFEAVRVGDDGFTYTGRSLGSSPLPDELILRDAQRMPLDDPDAIVKFINDFGPLTEPQRGLEFPIDDLSVEMVELLGTARFEWQRDRTRVAEKRSLLDVDPNLTPIFAAADRIRILRALVDHWAAYRDGEDDGIGSAWVVHGFPEPESDAHAWQRWSDCLNVALRPFAFKVNVEIDGVLQEHLPRTVTAFAALTLQLFNAIAGEATWHRCSNEPCGGLFEHQLGRAQFDQHRSVGVKFCSHSCAKAQMQREYRRRKRAESRTINERSR